MAGYSQNAVMDKHYAKNMLQGLWALAANDSITMAISGDTLVDYHIGYNDVDVLNWQISTQPCDNQPPLQSPTGLYFSIVSDGDHLLSAPLRSVIDREFRLLLDSTHVIIFEKLQ